MFQEVNNKLRGSIAYAISTIAHFDWPEQWSQLFGVLMQTLKSNELHAVDGTMKVLVGESFFISRIETEYSLSISRFVSL